jgi:flagellar biosynthesis/type III secretory pathway protein FliH
VEWFDEKTFNQIELLKHSCINEEQFLNNMLIFREQAKEMYKDEMEAAAIISSATESTSKASSYAEGYKEGYNRALELSKWAISNLVPPHNEQQ